MQQLTSGIRDRFPDISPDSRWVVYTAAEDGRPATWRILIDGGVAERLSDVECNGPRFSHDGKRVACAKSGIRVHLISSVDGHFEKTVELPEGAWWDYTWTADDRAIRFGVTDSVANWSTYGTMNWWMQPIDGGPAKPLTNFKPGQPGSTPVLRSTWSPNGRDLLYSHFQLKSDVVMMSTLK